MRDQTPAGFEIARTPSTHTIAILHSALKNIEVGTIIAAYDHFGNCFGAAEIGIESNHITIFGDDPTTTEKDGFFEGGMIFFKTGFDETLSGLAPAFDHSLPQSDGQFTTNGLSAIAAFKEATGISENDFSLSVNIYPNPSNGRFEVHGDRSGFKNLSGLATWEITNSHGTRIATGQDQFGDFTIDIPNHPKGIYYLKITQGGLQTVRKLVLQ